MSTLHKNTIHGAKGAYLPFLKNYYHEIGTKSPSFDIIIEIGSRDCADAIELFHYTKKPIYSFECNPSALDICKQNLSVNNIDKESIRLIDMAVSNTNGFIDFYCTVDTPNPPSENDINLIEINNKQANIGTSSMFEFTDHWKQVHQSKKIKVKSTKLSTFLKDQNIQQKYMLCMDVQGAEYSVLQSLDSQFSNCELIIMEISNNQYKIEDPYKIDDILKLLPMFNVVKKTSQDLMLVRKQ